MTTYLNRTQLQRRIYEAARDGIAVTLRELLHNFPFQEVNKLLDTILQDEGQTKCTPVLIASRNGHENVVKFLLENYSPDLEVEGIVEFGGYYIDGTTALWCAAGYGHINVVKTLVSYGAKVNHPTKAFSTPLRAACFDGRLDIVSFLVDNGADISISNQFNNTCLMIAAYKGNLGIVEYLLSKKCDPNSKAKCGGTACHFAAETGNLEILKCLLENNAQLTKNVVGMTPLISAAERTKANIVEYLVSTEYVSQAEKIDALELLGGSYANDKDNYSWERAYYYLAWAMKERFRDSEKPILKQVLPAMEAYGNRVECQTMKELDAIRSSLCSIHMEGLIVRERILGPENPEVSHPIIYRGALYADTARYEKCVPLWMRALKFKKAINIAIRKDIMRFTLIFSQMLHAGVVIPFDVLCQLIEVVTDELVNIKNFKLKTDDVEEKLDAEEEFDDNMHRLLCLIVIATKVLSSLSNVDEDKLCRLVYKFNKLDLRTASGATLLHLAINADTPVDDVRARNVCKFPCAATAKLLIKAGAEVNAMTYAGNTPLHIIVNYQKPISDFLTLHTIVTCLIEASAHLDYVNGKGETPFQAAATGVAEIILRTAKESRISLVCLAAKVICKHNVPFESVVPKELVKFVKLHGAK